jgi:hypothetical protein
MTHSGFAILSKLEGHNTKPKRTKQELQEEKAQQEAEALKAQQTQEEAHLQECTEANRQWLSLNNEAIWRVVWEA